MRRFYAPKTNFADNNVTIDVDESRHMRDVLRLKTGDEVSVFDGTGAEFSCEITAISKKISWLAVIDEITPAAPESSLEITLAATILNSEKFDLIIQKAVELGVAVFIPLTAIRGDVKLKDAGKRMERWRRIALEATKQSGRAKLMQIIEPVAFDELISISTDKNIVLFSERDGVDFSQIMPVGEKITAIFGPKGGWDDSELEGAKLNDVKIVTLGGRILRAETAAIAITAILQHRFGDLK